MNLSHDKTKYHKSNNIIDIQKQKGETCSPFLSLDTLVGKPISFVKYVSKKIS